MTNYNESQWYRKRGWVEVNLNNLEHNVKVIKSHLGSDTKFLSVVKADAYGHGEETITHELEKIGTDYFGVSELEEALAIRRHGITTPILIFYPVPVEYAQAVYENSLCSTVADYNYALKLNEKAKELGITLDVHLKLDTGMGRLGIKVDDKSFEESIKLIEKLYELSNLSFKGIFTHFAVADRLEENFIKHKEKQYANYIRTLNYLADKGIDVGIRHCANSAATLSDTDYHFDMVRAGIIIYGLSPGPRCDNVLDLKPTMEMFTRITHVKQVNQGETISYGCIFTADKPTKVATLGFGYADGCHRTLSGKMEVLINGQRAKQIGTICMDQMMIDITGIDAKIGDKVTIVGKDGEESITWDTLAQQAQTISYELISCVSRRTPRIYIKDGKDVGFLNYLD